MTEGVIWKQLLFFAIPLLLGNLFQLLYNTVDSIVVGNFVGGGALAAVGASNPIINLLVSFFMGIATGAGVVISRYFGAEDRENLSRAVHTSMMLVFLAGIFLMAAGAILSPLLLLDEPAAGMNPAETAELTNLIAFIREHYHLTILLIEHDMSLVMKICERIYVLDYGMVIANGTPDEIKSNRKVIEAYLGEDVNHA